MISKRDQSFINLIEFLKTCEDHTISGKNLEKAIFEQVGTIDPRSQQNTVRKLLLGGYMKNFKKKPRAYMIMV